jgi:uncharacterized protein (TIGR03382 family)
VGGYCGDPYGPTIDGFCDCTEACESGGWNPSTCQPIAGGGTRPDGQDCSRNLFNTAGNIGKCTHGRCCDPMVALACNDDLACTIDLCEPGTYTCEHVESCPASPNECWPGGCAADGSGACANAYKGDGAPCSIGVCAGGTGAGACQAGCWIDGAFRDAGSLDPANPCQRCDASAPLGWSRLDDATPCGAGQLCVAGACLPGCLIDGAWRPAGSARPGAACWVCDPATPTAWTASFGPCAGDELHCTDDRCGGDGVCHHDPIPGCKEPVEESLYGCSATGGAGGLLLAAAALLAAGRRRRSVRLALLVALLIAPILAAAAPAANGPGRPTGARRSKVAVLGFKAGTGVSPQVAELVTRTISAAIQERTGNAVLTTADLIAVLGFEQQQAALGCTEDQCLSEMGGALGVDWLVTGALGRLGESLAFNAQILEIRTGLAVRRFATTLRAPSDERFLDLVVPAVEALFPDARPPPRFALSVRGEAELRSPLGGGGAILLEARIGDSLRAGGGLLATPSHAGALGRLAWLPWRPAATLHPVVALEVTVLAGGGAALGVGVNPGIEWAPSRAFAVLVEVPLQWFPAAPEHTRGAYALAAASAAWRF